MTNDVRVTVVCCTNNKTQLQKELLNSLAIQDEKFEIIIIDNEMGIFDSCSAAFNSKINNIKTKYVVFSHQDIILGERYSLKRFVEYMKDAEIGDLFGVAGTELNQIGVLTAIYHGTDRRPAGRRKLKGIKKCDVIDECFFGGLTETFIKYPFDENLCNGWHLYAVERCLNNRLYGHSVYVCEIPLEHSSTGRLNHAFYENFKKLCRAYHKNYPEIYTTCERTKTGFFSRNIHCFIAELKSFIMKFLNYVVVKKIKRLNYDSTR